MKELDHMPRVAKEIKCNESDILSLESIVANPLSDPHLATKATALLLCIRGMDNKGVASELGVRKNTVGDWRKAFIDGGIEGLKGKKRPGRRGNNAPDMRERVKEKFYEKPADGEEWTAKSLSEAVGTSVDTVRRALREEGVSLERRTRWTVPVERVPSPEAIGIAGIYLSANGKAIIIYTAKKGKDTLQHGRITWKSSAAAERLEDALSADGYVPIADALEILSQCGNDTGRHPRKAVDMQDYLNGIGRSMAGKEGFLLHAIVLKGKDTGIPSLTCPNLSVTLAQDFESWITLAGLWVEPLCGTESERIRSALSRYTDEYMAFREPLIWNVDVAETQQNVPGEDRPAQQEDMFSDPTVNNVLRVSATILGRDGREIHREAEIPNGVPGLDEIDYGSPLALGASVGKVERAISGGMSGVAKGLCEGYVNAALKKTEHPARG